MFRRSPGFNSASSTDRPLTNVPCLEPRSRTSSTSSMQSISQCSRLTQRSPTETSVSDPRPKRRGKLVSTISRQETSGSLAINLAARLMAGVTCGKDSVAGVCPGGTNGRWQEAGLAAAVNGGDSVPPVPVALSKQKPRYAVNTHPKNFGEFFGVAGRQTQASGSRSSEKSCPQAPAMSPAKASLRSGSRAASSSTASLAPAMAK